MKQSQCMDGYKLVQKYHHLVLKQTVSKILCFSAAFDDTFVFSKVINPGADESIVHVNKYGEVLFQVKYPDIINYFGMLNEEQVILMYVPDQHIDIINLRNRTKRSIQFNYLYDDVAQMKIETFHDTKMFCIVQMGCYNKPQLRLSYFRYGDCSGIGEIKVQSCSEYRSADNIWTYQCTLRRLNCTSKIGWFLYKHKEYIQFYVYSLDKNPKGELQLIRVKNTIGIPYGRNYTITLANLWETSTDTYLLVTNSNKQQEGRNHEGVINNNYILNVKDDTIRQTEFYFKDPKDGFSWNDQMIEYFNLGDFSVFHTFRHEAGKTLTTPVYYIDNLKETIVDQHTWEATCYVNFFVPGFAKNTVIQGFFQNDNVKEIGVTARSLKDKFMDQRIPSMFFMLHLNEDFDDDLLYDAIDLLHG